MPRGNGGVIGPANIPTTASAKGVWSLVEQMIAKSQGIWPSSVLSDPYYEYTTLLLPGNGTNGAQNNTFLDSSTNNFTITRNGNTTQGTFSPFSQTGWGNYFDGSGDYLSVASNAAFDFAAGDFTIETFVYPTTASQLALIARGETTGFSGFICSTTNFLATTNGSSWDISITFTNALTANAWNHVAVVRNGNVYTVYKDGNANGTTTVSGTIVSGSAALVVGRRSGQTDFSGYISNLRLVKGTAVYTAAFTPPTSPLTAISNTSLLTCQSNRFRDASTNNFTITVNGSPSVQAFSPFNPSASWSAATYGGSGYFDGNGDYLTATTSSLNTTTFTLEFWGYFTVLNSGSPYYVFNLSGGGSGQLLIGKNDPGFPGRCLFVDNSGSTVFNLQGGTINANEWTHFACVKDGANASLWINGTRVATTSSAATSPTFSGTSAFWGGLNSSVAVITGYLSSFRLVSGSAVYSTSSTSITVPTAPLTAITNTSLLLNYTNAGIYDATSKNDLETVADAKISTAQSKWGGSSMAFDGTGDWLVAYGSLGDLSNFGAGDFTIEAWVRFSDLSGTRALCGKWGGASNRGWFFYYEANNIYFAYSTTGSNAIDALGSWTPSINTWYYVAVTRSGANLKLYVDGSQKGTTHNISTSSIYASTTVFSVAQRGDNFGALSGYLQDLRITKGVARDVTVVPTAAFPTL